MTEETNTAPEVPALPANYFSDSKARADHFAATVKAFETAQPAAPTPEVKASREHDLAQIDATAKHVINGKPLMLHEGGPAVIEKLRTAVLEGKPLDVAAARAEIETSLGLFEQGAARLEAGEVVPVSELPAAMLAGYIVSLPEGWGVGAYEVQMLAAARSAGIDQATVDRYLAALIAQAAD